MAWVLTESGCAVEYRLWGARVKTGQALNFVFALIPLQYGDRFSEGRGGAGGMGEWVLGMHVPEQRTCPCRVS